MAYFPCIVQSGSGISNIITGTFTSSDQQYGIVSINCGFEPDFIIVTLPFGNDDTTSYWWKDVSWANTHACWNLYPVEYTCYFVELGRQSGETGIQAITSTGFTFMSNGWNTLGINCSYVAGKYT